MNKKSKRNKIDISLKASVVRALRLLEVGGIGAVLNWLRQDFPIRNQVTQGWWSKILYELARQKRQDHPVSSLSLLQEVLLLAPDHVPALLMSASLQERLGDRKASRFLALQVLASAQASPEQRMFACQLCAKDAPVADLMGIAHAAWHEAGRPLVMADGLLDMALRAASWLIVDEVLSSLKSASSIGVSIAGLQSPRTHLLWCDDELANIAVLVNYAARFSHAKPANSLSAISAKGRRLRVAYLSSDYRDHPTSRLLMGLLRHHDRTQVEVFLYCSGWNDGSSIRKAIIAQADQFRSVAELSDLQVAQCVRDDAIDILVELNGPTRANRMGVLAHRPAPVQIDYLGWPGSVGGKVVDYVVGDAYTVPPGHEIHYPEKVIRLNSVYQINDYAAMRRHQPLLRSQLGLPEGVPILGMFNQINKVRREVWRVWMDILVRVPQALIWLLDPGPLALENLRQEMDEMGVDPSRLLVAPRCPQAQHLARLQHCELMLDPWPYGGHTTTADALFAGVPVVTLEGRNFAGRVSGALLHSAGLGMLVQPNATEYVHMAVRILTDSDFSQQLRHFLLVEVRKTDVFDARSKTRQFEAAYRHMHALAVTEKPPEHINLQPRQKMAYPIFRPSAAQNLIRLPKLVLVCGPWSSGSSAVAGALAHAGIQAPGPYVVVNDPRTPQTYEMLAFQRVLKQLASEETMTLKISQEDALETLRKFRDIELLPYIQNEKNSPPLMLKHSLAILFIEQLRQLFDIRLVGVLRPLAAIEATRQRRRWHASMGLKGAEVIYRALINELVNGESPFHLIRYPDLLRQPAKEIGCLLTFCRMQATAEQRLAALSFVTCETSAQQSEYPPP